MPLKKAFGQLTVGKFLKSQPRFLCTCVSIEHGAEVRRTESSAVSNVKILRIETSETVSIDHRLRWFFGLNSAKSTRQSLPVWKHVILGKMLLQPCGMGGSCVEWGHRCSRQPGEPSTTMGIGDRNYSAWGLVRQFSHVDGGWSQRG